MKILRSDRARGRRGFTLIEMSIVLVIMLAFLAMSVPFFAGFSASTGLKTAEREIMTVLRTARSYAVSQNTNFNAVFNFNDISDPTIPTNTYRITNNAGARLDKTYPLPNGVTFTVNTTITFTPNGGLTGLAVPNTVIIRNNKNPDKTITVNRITGALE